MEEKEKQTAENWRSVAVYLWRLLRRDWHERIVLKVPFYLGTRELKTHDDVDDAIMILKEQIKRKFGETYLWSQRRMIGKSLKKTLS